MALSDVVEKLVKLPTRTKAVAMVVVCAFFGGIFYFVFYSELIEKLEKLDKDVTRLQGEKATYEDRKQKFQAFRAEVNRLLEEQKELLKVLPDEANLSTFLESIHAQAELAGVQIVTYDQGGAARKDFYAQIPVKMSVSGSYHQLCKFFYYLERDVKRIVKVENLSLVNPTMGPDGIVLKADFVASTFHFIGQRPG